MSVSQAIFEEATRLQRKGFTFTEIASATGVARNVIVDVLYYRPPDMVEPAPYVAPVGDMDARDEDILARYDAGERLEVIGNLHGLTRERVRQIADKHGRPMRRLKASTQGEI